MLNRIEYEIIGMMLRTPLDSFTIYSLTKKLNNKYSYIYRCIKNLQNKKIIKISKIGNANQCTINFDNADLNNITIASIIDKKKFFKKNINIQIIANLLDEKINGFYTALLFGSYAAGKNKKDSDIDLFFIIEDKDKVELFKKEVQSILSNLSYKTHIIVSTIDWFYNMIGEKESVGREILKSSIVMHNPELYYNLVRKNDKERGY